MTVSENSTALSSGDRLARHNALVLSTSMALGGANATIVISTGSLVGQMLAPSPQLVTLPVTTFVLGTALLAYPASSLMKHIGRRAGFMAGGTLGILAGLLGAAALWLGQFWLYVLATGLAGAYQSFVVLYRYGAADTASPALKPKVISWVLAGGVAAAIIGPQMVIATKDSLPPLIFLGTYFGQAALAALATLAVSFFRDGPVLAPHLAGSVRTLKTLLSTPKFLSALLGGLVAQSMMNMVMTATPIAMAGCGFSVQDSTLGIQWHVIAMYLPSFFTGHLLSRFGKTPVILTGMLLMALAGAANISGTTLAHFWGSLILLGLGWNFAFIGSTALVTDCHSPAERGKVQGLADFCIYGATTLASLMAGVIYNLLGWNSVNQALLLIVALAATVVLFANRPRPSTPQ